jgi:hypothetical protein
MEINTEPMLLPVKFSVENTHIDILINSYVVPKLVEFFSRASK